MSKKAFSLVELSLVIVIIGLLIGGISAGKQVIENAKLRATIAKIKQYEVALNSFYTQYKKLPGDIDNATDFWSGTQNGDADFQIDAPCTGGPNGLESLISLEHLSLAELITGSFTGIGVTDGAESELAALGTNVDNFPYAGSAAIFHYLTSYTLYSSGPTITTNKNVLNIGAPSASCPTLDTPILSSVEAYMIDQKLDDLNPGTGYILSGAATTDCAETVNSIYEYNVDSDETCLIYYVLEGLDLL